MKIYNVGLTTLAGENIGWHVSADHADHAISKARSAAEQNGTLTYAGATTQLRVSRTGYNEYFDRTFKYVGALL